MSLSKLRPSPWVSQCCPFLHTQSPRRVRVFFPPGEGGDSGGVGSRQPRTKLRRAAPGQPGSGRGGCAPQGVRPRPRPNPPARGRLRLCAPRMPTVRQPRGARSGRGLCTHRLRVPRSRAVRRSLEQPAASRQTPVACQGKAPRDPSPRSALVGRAST